MKIEGPKSHPTLWVTVFIRSQLIVALTILLFPFQKSIDATRRSGIYVNHRDQISSHMSLNAEPSTLDSLALESVLSLVQSYYVDADRVTHDQLMIGISRVLAAWIQGVQLVESDKVISLRYKNETLEFPRILTDDYSETIGLMRALIGFCERNKLGNQLEKGEHLVFGTSRDSTSLILNAMLGSLDAHSSLLSKTDYLDLRQGTEGEFGGFGLLVGVRNDVLTVIRSLPKSPASKFGFKKSDKILSIDGVKTFGVDLENMIDHLRGEPGSRAKLVTLREGDWAPRSVLLKREVIEVASVTSKEIHSEGGHMLYLKVDNFSARTSNEITDKIESFRRRYQISGLVLDLRGNPGGLLDQALAVSDIFLSDGVIVSTRGRQIDVEKASQRHDQVDFPMSVLIDGESASASEIVAGALKENDRAVVIGQPSFGKGSVQTVFEIPGQKALKLTIARYFTPSGKSIQNTGIVPDIRLQPVYSNRENINILGSSARRGEGYLPNRLKDSASVAGGKSQSVLKGYYLSPSEGHVDSIDGGDLTFNLALRLLKKVSSVYPNGIEPGATRASHWLALASKDLESVMNEKTAQAIRWIRQSQGIEWDHLVGDGFEPIERLFVSAEHLRADGSVSTGAQSYALVSVKNMNSIPLYNISIFGYANEVNSEPKEVLVGRLDGGQTKKIRLPLDISRFSTPGNYRFRLGTATDGDHRRELDLELLVPVAGTHVSTVKSEYRFVEERESALENVLEPREKARLRVEIINAGESIANGVDISLQNLAGNQIQLGTQNFIALGELQPGEKKSVFFPIQASDHFESETISLGISVTQGGSKWKSCSEFEIKTSKNLAETELRSLAH